MNITEVEPRIRQIWQQGAMQRAVRGLGKNNRGQITHVTWCRVDDERRTKTVSIMRWKAWARKAQLIRPSCDQASGDEYLQICHELGRIAFAAGYMTVRELTDSLLCSPEDEETAIYTAEYNDKRSLADS